MPSAWGHTRLLETDWRFITQESHCFSCGSVNLMFLEMWNAFRSDAVDPLSLPEVLYAPSSFTAKGYVQPFSDSPLDDEPLGENVYIEILSQARDYVYIFTPYLIIDNELQSALMAVAAYRDVEYGAILYGGDDVSKEKWDSRNWRDRGDIRVGLTELAKEILLVL